MIRASFLFISVLSLPVCIVYNVAAILREKSHMLWYMRNVKCYVRKTRNGGGLAKACELSF